MNSLFGLIHDTRRGKRCLAAATLLALAAAMAGCGKAADTTARADTESQTASVAVFKTAKKTLDRQLTLSSELVPYQETEVYAKQAGYVKEIFVDYGSHVKKGQLL